MNTSARDVLESAAKDGAREIENGKAAVSGHDPASGGASDSSRGVTPAQPTDLTHLAGNLASQAASAAKTALENDTAAVQSLLAEQVAVADAAKAQVKQRIAEDNEVADHKIALPFRLFGVICILAGLAFIPIDFLLIRGAINILVNKDWSTFNQVTVENQGLVLSGIEAAAYAAETVLFAVFGIRLVMNKQRGAARMTGLLIAITLADMILTIMIHGFGANMIQTTIVLVFLVTMYILLDPALHQEQALQRKLRALEARADQQDGTLGRDKTGKGYLKLDFFNIFWLFIIASVVGLILESLVCPFLNGRIENRTGMLWGPFSPIYGVGAVLMVMALNRFWKAHPAVIFAVSGLIGGAFEFLASWFYQFAFGISAWDYSAEPFNFDGRTDLLHIVCWGILGLVLMRWIVPHMLDLINKIPWNWRYGLTTVCAALMIFNAAMTLLSFDCWYLRMSGRTPETPIEQFMESHFDDAYMKNHFATMTIDPARATRN